MGSGTSKITHDRLSEIITKSIISSSQDCRANASQSFKLDVEGVKGDFILDDLSVSQKIDVDLECLQSSINTQEIKRKVETELKQKLEAIPFWDRTPFQESYNKGVTKIVNDLKVENVKACIASISTDTSIEIKEVDGSVKITNVDVEQVTSIVKKCVQADELTMKNLAELNDKVESQAVQTIPIWGYVAGGVVVLILLLLFVRLFKRKKKPAVEN